MTIAGAEPLIGVINAGSSSLSDRTAIMTAIGLGEGSTDFEVLGAIA
jgi:hypothetical protein